jgi:hypothetical protein
LESRLVLVIGIGVAAVVVDGQGSQAVKAYRRPYAM